MNNRVSAPKHKAQSRQANGVMRTVNAPPANTTHSHSHSPPPCPRVAQPPDRVRPANWLPNARISRRLNQALGECRSQASVTARRLVGQMQRQAGARAPPAGGAGRQARANRKQAPATFSYTLAPGHSQQGRRRAETNGLEPASFKWNRLAEGEPHERPTSATGEWCQQKAGRCLFVAAICAVCRRRTPAPEVSPRTARLLSPSGAGRQLDGGGGVRNLAPARRAPNSAGRN